MSIAGKVRSVNTLVCLLQGLEGQITTIDLRNECSVAGEVEHVDYQMNTQLREATLTTPSGKQTTFSTFYVKGVQIRYVHIPEDVDVMKLVQAQIDIFRGVKNHQERQTKRLSHWNQKLQVERQKRRLLKETEQQKQTAEAKK